MKRPSLTVFYLGVIQAAGLLSAVSMATQTGRANPLTFIFLLFFACGTARLKVRLPGVDRSVSLSFAFSFLAITELPASSAFFIVGTALVYESMLETGFPRWAEVTFNLSSAAVSTLCTHKLYNYFSHALRMDGLLALGAAAVTYYAVTSSTSAVQVAFQSRTLPWKVWNEKFFWMGPLYLLVPVAAALTTMLGRASGVPDRLLGLMLIFGGYRYVKHYFARLHDQQDHAERMDEIRQRTIESLALAIEAKDGGTAGHLQRVRRHALLLAQKLGCSEIEIKTLELGALLHDVGKVCVPDYILGKPGRLTEHEFNQIANHAKVGADIVTAVQFPFPVEEIVRHHHEHWDGSGYPRQLCGRQIPKLARILTIVDSFDALVMDRPYRAAMPINKAVEVMHEQRGKLFDPEILDIFLQELPSFSENLERELKQERARMLLDRSPVQKVRQTWLTDAEANETALRRMTFEKLASVPEQLVLLYDVMQILGSGLDARETIRKTLEMLHRAIPYDIAALFALEGRQYVLMQTIGMPDHCVSRLSIPIFHGALENAAKAKRPVVGDGPPAELAAGLHRYFANVRSTLAAPLFADDKVVGALALCSTTAKRFDQDQAWFLGLVTEKLAATIASSHDLEKLRMAAATDAVTGLANARATVERLETEIERARREDATLAVLYMDLNRFKLVNDTYGHAAGDKLLAKLAERLKSCLRPYDFVGRLGGDEFLAILPRMDEASIRLKIDSLKKAANESVVTLTDGTTFSTGINIGVACYPADARDAEELIVRSDQRMYADKKQDPAFQVRNQPPVGILYQ